MESASNTGFGNIINKGSQNETSPKANASREPTVAANKLNDIPEALQEVKKPPGETAVENVMERIRMAKNGKEKQSNDLDRAGLKRKLESEEKPAVKKDARMLELDNQLATMPRPHIPLKSLMDVEIKLVYIDEEDITYEFVGSMASTSTQSMCRDVEIVDTLSAPNFSFLPQIDKWLQVALKDASTCYRQKKYAVAAGQFRTALEKILIRDVKLTDGSNLVSGMEWDSVIMIHLGIPLPFHDVKLTDGSNLVRWIKSAIQTLSTIAGSTLPSVCPGSIILNPAYFLNHLRQAAVFRWLERYSEAARSAMTADYVYWLSGGSEQHISKLIKLYWQAMIEEAITREESFSVMYTPFATKAKADKIDKMKEAFAKKHPDYVAYIYTGVIEKLQYASLLSRLQRVKEQSQVINQAMAELATIPYLQDISQQDAELLQSLMADAMDTLEGRSDTERVWNKIQKRGPSVLPRTRSATRMAMQMNWMYAKYERETLYLSSASASKIVTSSGSRSKARIAQPFRRSCQPIVGKCFGSGHSSYEYWVGIIEDFLYHLEDNFLKTKKLRTARRQKMKMKRLQSVQQH
ncbi:Spermatogenesis-associated protein 16 [Chelonia mydas]|uniref:Spermatogenesis-associated protein 16 n=1 Tax=Chelonia mydas TaxID=8469 RepID=M7BME6_CHEMY|nr:Spermatogenesis-associated protein 16 [Chelonia mydas]